MRQARGRTVGAIKRLRQAQGGVAAVEFALIVPLLLLIYVGTIEASSLITMDRKVQAISGALGDLVARTEDRLPTSDLRDYFRAASGIMTPYAVSEVRQTVTVVSISPTGSTSVEWSREFFGGTYENGMLVGGTYQASAAHPYGSSYPVPEEMIAISLGGTVIAAEASYSYLPLFGIVFDQPINLRRASFFAPRFPGTIRLN